MYGYKNTILKLKEKIGILIDPEDTSGDPQPIFGNVELGKPENIGLYNGPLAVLLFAETSKTGSAGMRGQSKMAIIDGAVITFIPGDNTEAALKCLHYSDIIEDSLEDENLLGIPGCVIEVPDSNTQNWRVVDVSPNPNKPKKCTAAATKFKITKTKER